jgi:hypothetical protein
MTPVQHQRLGPSSTFSERVRVTSTFVPSEKTPLIDILLSRTIFGGSPSKLATTSYHSRSTSPSKVKRDNKASKPQESPLNQESTLKHKHRGAGGLLNGNAVQVRVTPRAWRSRLIIAPGPSAEPGDNDPGTGTKKKVGTTRKGGG